MLITVVNRSRTLSTEKVLAAIRAINRQISEDFEPYWSFGATLRLEGAVGSKADTRTLAEMRGDAILYLSDTADVDDALGYHDKNNRGVPYGFVFTELCKELKENWTVTLSHEALELIGDAQGNLLVQGPHPDNPNKEVFHWFEMCDAVQSQTYRIDGVEVSNFLLPLYFTPEEQEGGRNDYLGRRIRGKTLASFGVSPGGYIGYYDPQTRTHETYSAPGDRKAQQRIKIKTRYKAGRGYLRKRGDATMPREQEHEMVLRDIAMGDSICPDPIRHVVVLMLENRSFDHMLGDATRVYPELEGIPQAGARYSNVSTKSGKRYEQQPNAAESVSVDLPHEHDDVMQQLGSDATHLMGGFVDAYLRVAGVSESKPGQVDQVMAYFPLGDTPAGDTLPALHALARDFCVCDHWFSSMPGPTWPNRFFIHSGTCLGHVHMPSREHPEYLYLYDQDTVYDRLDKAKRSWRIYHDGTPQSVVLSHLWLEYGISLLTDKFSKMSEFFEDAAGKEAGFPEFVFIEPSYFGSGENDQHPPTGVTPGDQLITKVYNAIRRNKPLWESTLLIVTYDEHGGFYDHVPPPVTVAPDRKTKEFDFKRLGVRVPAILVSPWVERGVCKTAFDHTSVLRYLCDKWEMAPLGRRTSSKAGDYQANSFLPELVKRSTPREDTPESIPSRSLPRGRVKVTEPPVEGSREALMYFLSTVTGEGAPPRGRLAARTRKVQPSTGLNDRQLERRAEKRFDELFGAQNGKDDPGEPAKPRTRRGRKPRK